jgi:hypothetical protein
MTMKQRIAQYREQRTAPAKVGQEMWLTVLAQDGPQAVVAQWAAGKLSDAQFKRAMAHCR